jgi:hypothetical protein
MQGRAKRRREGRRTDPESVALGDEFTSSRSLQVRGPRPKTKGFDEARRVASCCCTASERRSASLTKELTQHEYSSSSERKEERGYSDCCHSAKQTEETLKKGAPSVQKLMR